MAGSRVILPLASAKALLDRDLEQGKIPETTKLDIAWDFEMAQMIGADLKPTMSSEESFHLRGFGKVFFEERQTVSLNGCNYEGLVYVIEDWIVDRYLKEANDKRLGFGGFYGDWSSVLRHEKLKLDPISKEYMDNVRKILEGDFCKWVRKLESPMRRLQDPDLVESIDWVVRRREEEINDVDRALELRISPTDKALIEPLRRIDLDTKVALDSLVEVMQQRFFEKPPKDIRNVTDETDSPSTSSTHR